MNGYTHMVVGGLTGGIAVAASISAKQFDIEINHHTIYPMLFVVPAVIGGLGPDIDMPNSKSGRFIRKALFWSIIGSGAVLVALALLTIVRGGIMGTLLPLLLFFVLVCGLMVFVSTVKHRRETHSGILCLALLLPLVWMLLSWKPNMLTGVIISLWIGFWIGWLSHLVADSFNKKGVPWLFPLKNAKGSYTHFHIMSVKTGTEEETIFRIGSIGAMVVLYLIIVGAGRWFI